jgi:hypothetical protein
VCALVQKAHAALTTAAQLLPGPSGIVCSAACVRPSQSALPPRPPLPSTTTHGWVGNTPAKARENAFLRGNCAARALDTVRHARLRRHRCPFPKLVKIKSPHTASVEHFREWHTKSDAQARAHTVLGGGGNTSAEGSTHTIPSPSLVEEFRQ